MKASLKSDLMRDNVLNAAHKHRRKRVVRRVFVVLLPVCAAAFVMWPMQEVPIVTEVLPEVEEESFVTLSTDDELLESLAHLGPVIVTREDGSEWLYLTNE